jgi:DNA-binding winged helix-turn-helix (wHTH) protein/TolB-like protein
MKTGKSHIYEFAGFRLDESERQLLRDKQPVALTPRAFDLLLFLVKNKNRLVEKNELLEVVWEGSFVEEANVNVNISTLRKALGERKPPHKYIQTIPKKGYRFVGDVHEIVPAAFPAADESEIIGEKPAAGAAPKTLVVNQTRKHQNLIAVLAATAVLALVAVYYFRQTSSPNGAAPRTIAVLPFKSLDGETDEHLGIGIADTVIGKVSRIDGIIVRPTSAVQKYTNADVSSLEAAAQLGVDAVLDGTVQRAGDRLRVSANLLRANDGASLWTESFDVRLTDIFTIEDEVSKQVAARLQLKLNQVETARLVKRYTANPEAYEHYARGVQIFNDGRVGRYGNDRTRAAAEEFKRAVEIDPNYALAHAQLAYLYALIAVYYETGNPSFLGLAKQEMRAAEALDSELAETHLARYEIYFSVYENFQLDEGVRELQLAQRLNPNAGHIQMAHLYAHLGLEEPALRELQRAMEIDPTSDINRGRYITVQEMLGRTDEAIAASVRFFPDKPEHRPFYALLCSNRLEEAQKVLDAGFAKTPDDVNLQSSQILLLAVRGKLAEADAEIPKIVAAAKPGRGFHHIAHDIAAVYALEGNAQKSVEWLQKAADAGLPNYPMFARDPNFERIRQEEVFVQFMANLKKRWDVYDREFQ